ncbi:MAG: T9SS type A sorting domain-containing protein [Bacteroidia bacterium]
MYPTPVQNTLFIRSELESKNFEQVRLWDSQGRILQDYTHLPNQISFAHLPAGLYHLSFVTKKGKVFTYKILKEF